MSEARRRRLFVALELPGDWREALAIEARTLESAAPGFGRWVDPSLLHVTLVFLGNQDANVLSTIERAVESAAASSAPFTLRLSAPGCFGESRSLRVVWVGVHDQPAGALAGLHGAVVAHLEAAKVVFDATPFRAHITLGRARRDATPAQSEAMHKAIARRAGLAAGLSRGFAERSVSRTGEVVPCEEVTLMDSDLRPRGPIYTPLYRAKLDQREGAGS